MQEVRFHMDVIQQLQDIFSQIQNDISLEEVKADFHNNFRDIDEIEILLIAYELKNGEHGIITRDVQTFFSLYEELYGQSISHVSLPDDKNHPIRIFIKENQALQEAISSIQDCFRNLTNHYDEQILAETKELFSQLGQFVNHYDRKEKIIFPILERYGSFMLTRSMWANDDHIRNLYKSVKSMLERVPTLKFAYVHQTYELFERKFLDMVFEEENFLLPVIQSYFSEEDWEAVARESEAFGYSFVEPTDAGMTKETSRISNRVRTKEITSIWDTENIPFGGGFLTLKEAEHILNNLPVEITFVDRYGVFKYFNDKVKASEMMFIRTPSSIGRNVAHCHPPKSMKKVMQLIRDLKTKRRSFECMWFKKDGRYVHITYKGLFDDEGEYLGILEYVQDIQPFFELPRETKKELQMINEKKENKNDNINR